MVRKRRTGVVVSDKMDKTMVILVERTVSHPLYRKVLRRRKRYQAHDERNDCLRGDTVLIEECRPLSKRKHWRVVRILERHEVADVQPREIAAPSLEDEPPADQPSEPAAAAPVPTPASADPAEESPAAAEDQP